MIKESLPEIAQEQHIQDMDWTSSLHPSWWSSIQIPEKYQPYTPVIVQDDTPKTSVTATSSTMVINMPTKKKKSKQSAQKVPKVDPLKAILALPEVQQAIDDILDIYPLEQCTLSDNCTPELSLEYPSTLSISSAEELDEMGNVLLDAAMMFLDFGLVKKAIWVLLHLHSELSKSEHVLSEMLFETIITIARLFRLFHRSVEPLWVDGVQHVYEHFYLLVLDQMGIPKHLVTEALCAMAHEPLKLFTSSLIPFIQSNQEHIDIDQCLDAVLELHSIASTPALSRLLEFIHVLLKSIQGPVDVKQLVVQLHDARKFTCPGYHIPHILYALYPIASDPSSKLLLSYFCIYLAIQQEDWILLQRFKRDLPSNTFTEVTLYFFLLHSVRNVV